jgi:ribosomal protein S12 methylthiotransferase
MGRKKKRKRQRKSGSPDGVTFGLVSLGCPKNLVDSEKIAARMLEAGFLLCEDEKTAEVVIVNTCCFIAPAREEALSVINEFADLKRRKGIEALVVAGCMAQQEGEKLLETHPGVDAAVSFSAYPRIAALVRRVLDRRERFFEGEREYELGPETGRLILSGPYTAYLRIAEGCSNACTFCTIPAIRGPLRSKLPEAVLEEARELAAFGIRELVVIAQDTTAYGSDLDENIEVAELLARLSEIEGLRWIRLMYASPERVTDKLTDVIANTPRVVKYLDLPVQHVSGSVVRRMGRRHGEEETRKLVRTLHERIPGLALRTSLIAGFPGETEEDFEKLLDFVGEGHFQRLGVFEYSREEGTPAAKMSQHLAPAVISERHERLMLAQREVAHSFARSLIGKRLEVLVEIQTEPESFEGRTYMDAPDIDCRALIETGDAQEGTVLEMEVVDTSGYDLILR